VSEPAFVTALGPVVGALDSLGVAHFIAGSVASSLHGVPRSTIDVDIIAQLRLEHAAPLASSLSADYYADVDVITEAVRRHAMFNLIHLATMIKLDVYAVAGRFTISEMSRRRRGALVPGGPASFAFATPEDVVLHKLVWYRDGGGVSERQWGDVLGVLRVQRALDRAYMDEWAAELGIADLLARAREEAEHG
jgi:hypothetical protein